MTHGQRFRHSIIQQISRIDFVARFLWSTLKRYIFSIVSPSIASLPFQINSMQHLTEWIGLGLPPSSQGEGVRNCRGRGGRNSEPENQGQASAEHGSAKPAARGPLLFLFGGVLEQMRWYTWHVRPHCGLRPQVPVFERAVKSDPTKCFLRHGHLVCCWCLQLHHWHLLCQLPQRRLRLRLSPWHRQPHRFIWLQHSLSLWHASATSPLISSSSSSPSSSLSSGISRTSASSATAAERTT